MRDGTGAAESLAELNRRFLDLEWTRTRVGEGLAALPDLEKSAIADCPYALFDLRFADADHWQFELQPGNAWHVAEAPPVAAETADFVRLALCYAWHCATSARARARLVFGMHERTAEAFAATSMARLATRVASAAPELGLRWSHCDHFWSALVNAANRRDEARLRRIQLYGIQLGVAAQLPLRPEPREFRLRGSYGSPRPPQPRQDL